MESDPPPCDAQKEQPQRMDPPPREVQKEQCDKGMQSQSALSEAQCAQNEAATSLPSADPRDTGDMQCDPAPSGMQKNRPYIKAPHVNSFVPCPIAMTHQSLHAQSEVATVQPTVEIKESGAGLGKSLDNPGAYLPPQVSCLEPGGRPWPHQAYGAGQNSDPDEAFTLH
ncbi:hypothetical protein SCLCIDRAFT_22726 [Scleroderma citrinum Foug A]|uniref:Uncharacterized protein n=1 Tax=Scleroderma citrinum Foug A TaxID=1036808 RepID=A0A0C2ZVP7_9AGAM|nr:hypothetical protein SCLCIDRAFT_22726 [Scleroderma citrinum Foug A]